MFWANIIIQSRLSDLSSLPQPPSGHQQFPRIFLHIVYTRHYHRRTRGQSSATGRIARERCLLILSFSEGRAPSEKNPHSKHIFALLRHYNDGSRLSLSLLSIPFTQKFHSSAVASLLRNGPISFASRISESLRRKMRSVKKEPFSILHHHNTLNGLWRNLSLRSEWRKRGLRDGMNGASELPWMAEFLGGNCLVFQWVA